MALEIYVEHIWIKVKQRFDGSWIYWTEFDGTESIGYPSLDKAIEAAKKDVAKALKEHGNLSSPSQTGEDYSWKSYDEEF